MQPTQLWMSGEIQADLGEAYRLARQAIESAVNKSLQSLVLTTDVVEWAFIAVIKRVDHLDYRDVWKWHKNRKVLEFTLKISHQSFISADALNQKLLIIEALKRTVELMPSMGVSQSDCEKLIQVLEDPHLKD